MTFCPKFQHQPPDNWQDFELLCWDLWKTIWCDENTEKHGRIGQSQQGVDIYGQPGNGKKVWAGVQCKGKENFTNQTLTEKELIEEVEKAKKFVPPLSEYIFATTAPRDGKIQKVAREITQLHKSADLFSVTVYGWEDIDALLITHKPKLARQWYSDIDDGKSKAEITQLLRDVLKEERGATTLQGVGENVVSAIPNSKEKPSNKMETSTPSGQSQINIDASNSNDNKGKPPTVAEIQAVLRILPSLVSAVLSGGRAEGQSSSDATFASALAQAAGGMIPPDIYASAPGMQKAHPYENLQHPHPPAQSSLRSEMLPNDMPIQQQTPCTSTATTEAPRHPINTDLKTTDVASRIDCLAIIDQIRHELAIWNYDEALTLAKKLEDAFDSGRLTAELVVPSFLIILAQVHIIQTETNRSSSENHIERAKAILTQTEKLLGVNDSEQLADIEALRASIDNLERGVDIALLRLKGRQDPYAVRIRISILLNQQRVKEAMQEIDGLKPHERWCDLAATVYAVNDRVDKAQEIVSWATGLHDQTRYPQCVVRLADALLA